MTYFVGIDPGLVSGAWAVIKHNGAFVACGDIPHDNGRVQPRLLKKALQESIPAGESAEIVIEQVHSMPNQGVASTFAFGQACGVIYAVTSLMLVPCHFITPQHWKSHFDLIKQPKSASLELARSIWEQAPLKLMKHHGRAEALLMAEYGRQSFQ